MSLQEWHDFGWLKPHATSLNELSNLLAIPGGPGIDWWKGGEKLAQTALHHGKTVWWDGFTWDFVLTEKSQKEIAAWLSSHSIPQDNAKR